MLSSIRKRFERATAVIAPFDVRCCLILIALPLGYKLLSFDFTGLGDLCSRAPIARFSPVWLEDALIANRCILFAGDRTRYLQVVAAVLLAAVCVRPSRWLLAPAIVLVWLLDTAAYQYRFNIYTLSTPLALLTLLFVTPVRLGTAASWSLRPSADAKLAMLVCLTYVASYYVLAGAAKLIFDWRWVWVVKIGNYYPISYLWYIQVLPEPIDTVARLAAERLRAAPWLDVGSAMLVLVEQFLWLLAPFSMIVRLHAGLFACGYHMVVLLTTGIVFTTWMPIALAVSLPFSVIGRRFGSALHPVACGDNRNVPAGALKPVVVACAVGLTMACALLPSKGHNYPPFFNYLAFGWRYPEPADIKPFYRIGVASMARPGIVPMPLGHGGFLEFLQVSYIGVCLGLIVENRDNAAIRSQYTNHAQSLLMVTRSREANGWLLGRWRGPDHLLSDPGDHDLHETRRFYIMRGTPLAPTTDGKPVRASWKICGEFDLDAPTDETVKLYERCVDAKPE